MLGRLVLDAYSLPDLSRSFKVPETTLRRRIRSWADFGLIARLEGRAYETQARNRTMRGGCATTRAPVLYERGEAWLSVAVEVEQVMEGGRGGLAGQCLPRLGRRLKMHNAPFTCQILTPPSITCRVEKIRTELAPDPVTGSRRFKIIEQATPILRIDPFNGAQVIHRGAVEIEGLVWKIEMHEHPSTGWSSCLLRLSADSSPRIDAASIGAIGPHIWASALRAMNAVEKTLGCTLDPMEPRAFFKRIETALKVDAPVRTWLESLPEELRRWSSVEGEVWTDKSDGPADLESKLPTAGVLFPMNEVMAWAMRDPRALQNLALSLDALLERQDAMEHLLDQINTRLAESEK